jgi:spermidine synthase
LEYPIKIKPSDGELVGAVCSGRHNIEVREGEGLRWMHFGGDAIQAMMILQDPSRPIIPYQIYMLGALLFHPAPDFVLNLGVGGGSFERFFAVYVPQAAVTSVESNAEVVRLLRDCFPILAHMPVINLDAEKYLTDCATTYDLILCDLFDSGGNLPLTTKSSFYREVERCLSNNGIFVINLLPDTEAEMVDILAAVRESFQHVLLLLVPLFQNTVLYCLKQDSPDSDMIERRATKFLQETGIDLTDIADLVVQLPQREKC